MPSLDSKSTNATRRLDRAIARDRLRTILIIIGAALVIGGILLAVIPFGPPISNPVAIPKADPHAGLWLAQALPAGTALRAGLAIAAVGVAVLAFLMLLGVRKSRNSTDKNV